ncbi:MAG: hypothetical protein FWH47_00890 [Methanomassiliicoccaceae archaeon]|nr:hypothetical protein [Methanomassiliicoccaceae archaeon]
MDAKNNGERGKPILRDNDVREIVAALKYIPLGTGDPLKRMREKNGHYRAAVELTCPSYDLSMRLRRAVDDDLDFSVLLIYTDSRGSDYIIRRYNGDHGKHTDPFTGDIIRGPHIHKITERCQRTLHKAEGYAEPTTEYHTLPQATRVFMRDMNISYEEGKGVTTLERFGVEL